MSKGSSRLARYIRAPIRLLGRARDLYVNSMNGCAARFPDGGAAGAAGVGLTMGPVMQRSFSRCSSRMSSAAEEDLLELIRAASQSRHRDAPPVRRSQSVAVGRIDEDQPCDFGPGEVAVGADLLFPRIRSYSVGGGRKSTVGVM